MSTGIGVFQIKLFKIRRKSYSKFVSNLSAVHNVKPSLSNQTDLKWIRNQNFDALMQVDL